MQSVPKTLHQNRTSYPLKIAMLGSFPPLRGISSYCLALSAALAVIAIISSLAIKEKRHIIN